jgi:hypothetical protein
MRLILSITNSYPAIITTTCRISTLGGALVAVAEDHDYSTGLIIRLRIPKACGMQDLDKYQGEITVVTANSFSIDIDTSAFEPFSIPVAPIPAWADVCAQVVPIGEDNEILTQAIHNVRG